MSARDVVLRRVRDALGPAPTVTEIARGYRMAGGLDAAAVVALFAGRVDDYQAAVHPTAPGDLAHAVATILSDAGHSRVVVPAGLPDAWLTALPDGLELLRDDPPLAAGDLDRADAVVTGCAVAIAETGTIVLDAADAQGRRAITLVPDHHVCVVHAERIVQTVPEALARLDPTRPLTMISGPSATSDIELDRVEGVHGPRSLDVLVVARRER